MLFDWFTGSEFGTLLIQLNEPALAGSGTSSDEQLSSDGSCLKYRPPRASGAYEYQHKFAISASASGDHQDIISGSGR